jgi:antitoxin (DNA-binding transcriptional repressor) of toxin-antitoxin stability system
MILGSGSAGNHLSQYLKRVTAGERFEVTERNQAVAILAPLSGRPGRPGRPGRSSALDRLEASGRIIPARLDLTQLGPPPDEPREVTISEALEEQRREE